MKNLIFLLFFSIFLRAETEIYASFDVVSEKSSKLSLQAVGIVKNINVEISNFVKKGDVLLNLDTSSEEINLKNLKNLLSQANLAKKFANSTLHRLKLSKDSISKQNLDKAQFDFETADLKTKNIEIQIEILEDQIAKKTLKAPFDGVIAAKFIEIGQGIATPNQPLIELISYPNVKILLSFDSNFKDLIKVGQIFKYKIKNKEFESKISIIYPQIQTQTRKIFAECEALNLTPGTFGEGKILVK